MPLATVHAKFHQAKCSGPQVITLTKKKSSDDAENNIALASSGSNYHHHLLDSVSAAVEYTSAITKLHRDRTLNRPRIWSSWCNSHCLASPPSLHPHCPVTTAGISHLVLDHTQRHSWLGSVTVRTLDLRSWGRGFDSRSGHYQVVTTWMGDCLRTGEPSRYITHTKFNSAFHPSGVGKSSMYRPAWLRLRWGTLTCVGCQVTLCDPIWQVKLRSSVTDLSIKSYTYPYLFYTHTQTHRQTNTDMEGHTK